MIIFRNVRINFSKNMQTNSIRQSCRHSINYYFQKCGKDKRTHRCAKRSIKHFEKIAINRILYDI